VLRQRVAHLATASATGTPHVIPVCFALVADALYVALDEKPKQVEVRSLRRVRNVVENPHVSVVFDHYEDNWSRLGFVLASGTARLLEGGPEHDAALASLRARYAQYVEMALEQRPLIAIDVARVTTWGSLD
jgi:PPOX class probable F420-dependent enzyme